MRGVREMKVLSIILQYYHLDDGRANGMSVFKVSAYHADELKKDCVCVRVRVRACMSE